MHKSIIGTITTIIILSTIIIFTLHHISQFIQQITETTPNNPLIAKVTLTVTIIIFLTLFLLIIAYTIEQSLNLLQTT